MSGKSLWLLALMLFNTCAHAELQGRLPQTPGGTDFRAYYDSILGVTWATDANATRNTWNDSNDFISGFAIAGVRSWRLPSMDVDLDGTVVSCDQATEIECRDNELGYMFYQNLEGSFLDNLTGDQGPFVDIQPRYWSATQAPLGSAYGIDFRFGSQFTAAKSAFNSVWAVHDGDVGDFDNDADGFPDDVDNCTFVANFDQVDSDEDGIGNACDADLNNDCEVNVIDLGLLRTRFFSADLDADFNSDGAVNVVDLGIMRTLFFEEPGPTDGDFCKDCDVDPWVEIEPGFSGVPGDGETVDTAGNFAFGAQPDIPIDADGVTFTVFPADHTVIPTRIQPLWRLAGTEDFGCAAGLSQGDDVVATGVNGVTGYAVVFTRANLETIANAITSGACGDVTVADLEIAGTEVFSGSSELGTLELVNEFDAMAVNIGEFSFPCDVTVSPKPH